MRRRRDVCWVVVRESLLPSSHVVADKAGERCNEKMARPREVEMLSVIDILVELQTAAKFEGPQILPMHPAPEP